MLFNNRTTNSLVLTLLCLLGQGCVAEKQPEAIRLPVDLMQSLRDRNEESYWGACTQKEYARLYVHSFHAIGDGKLLWLLGAPDYLCMSNSFFPVVVDHQGDWRRGKFIEGEPHIFHRLSDNRWLLSSQWTVEATHPTMFYSSNGFEWQEVQLPENRDVDCCFEYLSRICVRDEQSVHLRFDGDGDEPTVSKSWYTTFDQLLVKKPRWIPTDEPASPQAECSTTQSSGLQSKRTEIDANGDVSYEIELEGRTLSFLIPRFIY